MRATILAFVKNRLQAGRLEEELASFFADKTNWRHLLTGTIDVEVCLKKAASEAKARLEDKFCPQKDLFEWQEYAEQELFYPVESFLSKAKSINLDKTPYFEDKLIGIKGQYLLFEEHGGLNMRKWQGYDFIFEQVYVSSTFIVVSWKIIAMS